MVKLYGSAGCSGCQLAKQFLDKNGIDFEYLDISSDDRKANIARKKELFAMGAKSIPVLVNGDKVMIGFELDKYVDMFGLKG